MQLAQKEVTQAFHNFLRGRKPLREVLGIIKDNTSDPIWLTGNYLYQGIANHLYAAPAPKADLDLILPQSIMSMTTPVPWRLDRDFSGNDLLHNPDSGVSAHLRALSGIYALKIIGAEANMDNYLAHVPLNVQSLYYDPKVRQVVGDIGIQALSEKVVRIQDLKVAEHHARRRNTSVEDLIREKARVLGFRAELP